jgi:hypothetical protein
MTGRVGAVAGGVVAGGVEAAGAEGTAGALAWVPAIWANNSRAFRSISGVRVRSEAAAAACAGAATRLSPSRIARAFFSVSGFMVGPFGKTVTGGVVGAAKLNGDWPAGAPADEAGGAVAGTVADALGLAVWFNNSRAFCSISGVSVGTTGSAGVVAAAGAVCSAFAEPALDGGGAGTAAAGVATGCTTGAAADDEVTAGTAEAVVCPFFKARSFLASSTAASIWASLFSRSISSCPFTFSGVVTAGAGIEVGGVATTVGGVAAA